jgi:hypothetical protein
MTHDQNASGKLKNCPFCGGTATVQNYDDKLFYVACNSVQCFCVVGEGYGSNAMPDHSFISAELAAKEWNTRSPSPSAEAVGKVIDVLRWVRKDISPRKHPSHKKRKRSIIWRTTESTKP